MNMPKRNRRALHVNVETLEIRQCLSTWKFGHPPVDGIGAVNHGSAHKESTSVNTLDPVIHKNAGHKISNSHHSLMGSHAGSAKGLRHHALTGKHQGAAHLNQGKKANAQVHIQGSPLRDQTLAAMLLAGSYLHDQVATHGGYLWKYSSDLSQREGEKTATNTQIWVQPPGTPAVGQAFLTAYQATGDATYLNYAVDAANALVQGQLRSGGWRYSIEFDPALRTNYNYRVDPVPAKMNALSNLSTLDDDTTTAALRLLMQVDQATGFKNKAIHEASLYGLNALVGAQYPNGAWPQRFSGPSSTNLTLYPVQRASYPASVAAHSPWYPNDDGQGTFGSFYTINDNLMVNTIDTMMQAATIYNKATYLAVAAKGAGFLIRSQMPSAQPAWAQQYDFNTQPAWARKFEPPAISSYESQFVLQVLIRVYQATGDTKYLAPIPKALAYLKASTLPDGNLARFYELKTNKPLYITADYQMTYTQTNLLPGYMWAVKSQVDQITKAYNAAVAYGPGTPAVIPPTVTVTLENQVSTILSSMDASGRWLTQGRMLTDAATDPLRSLIETTTFNNNMKTLSTYIVASR